MEPSQFSSLEPQNPQLSALLDRINELKQDSSPQLDTTSQREDEGFAEVESVHDDPRPADPASNGGNSNPPAVHPSGAENATDETAEGFFPREPRSFDEAKIKDAEVEALVLKFLLSKGAASGRDIANQVKLPFILIEHLLHVMKNDQLIGYTGAATAGDYVCRLSDVGRERAKRLNEFSTYFGAAPVALDDYIRSVSIQSLDRQRPKRKDLERAFSDLLLNQRMFGKLGPAVNSGRGLFLFGYPGNGKTSIAERITRSFGRHTWLPRAIGVDGEVIRLFDPVNHVEAPLPKQDGLLNNVAIDQRWVRIERPTIVVGGELQMSHLSLIHI